MRITVVTPAVSQPVDLATLKAHLRLNSNAEDTLLQMYLDAATELLISQTGYTPKTTTYRLFLDDYPADRIAQLPRTPVTSLVQVINEDDSGTRATVTGSWLNGNKVLLPTPTTTTRSLEIDFIAGDSGNPAIVKTTILCLAAHFYSNRESYGETDLAALPQGFEVVCQLLRGAYGVGGQK